ncbi:hypothetical protein CKF54_02125 [Psittacicella hinzii]|uniref:Porin n=1 Tax=Psittacicella hinzii TaxID=2028575 RepID=A0A3A1Y802_9GAMM|nr:porin [Psittacicella hinzii]RIY33775.1 hypothetical protein CKF54_02125 [Psittacicella hinzii]
MKKTLLALAVVSVASSAFANTNLYTYSNGNTSANLGVFAEARYFLQDRSVKVNGDSANKEDNKYNQGRLRFGLYGSMTDSNNLTYSFYTRFNTRFDYHSQKVAGIKSGEHTRDGVEFNRGYVQLSHPTYGSFLFGKYVTVADDKFGNDMEADHYAFEANDERGFTAWTAPTSFDTVVTYLAPEFYGVKGGLSYGETKASQYQYTKQYALQASYNLAGNHVVFNYANTRNRADLQTTETQNSYDLAFYNDGLVQDFVLGAAFTYEHTSTNTEAKDKAWSLAAKARYTGFQYAQPFLNLAYVKEKVDAYDKSSTTKTRYYNLAVGAASDVYTYETAKVTVFAEYFYSRAKETVRDVQGSTKTKNKGFNVGAKLTF